MCERMKRRTVCNERGNSGPQRERDVNDLCKTWTNVSAVLFLIPSLSDPVQNTEEILPNYAYMINHSCGSSENVRTKSTRVTLLSTGKLWEAADIITSAPPSRASITWQKSIILTPSQSSSTITSTTQQVNRTARAIWIHSLSFNTVVFVTQ